MPHSIEVTFDGTAFFPIHPVALPTDVHYRIIVEPMNSADTGDVWSLLKEAAGSIEAPADWSSQHDHYLYGTPKREPEP